MTLNRAEKTMLDEYAIQPDPMSWHRVPAGELGIGLAAQCEAVLSLVGMGLLHQVGHSYGSDRDPLYALTPEGRAYWKKEVQGKRRRAPRAPAVPKYSSAVMAAAAAPVDVFDLARVPWTCRLPGRVTADEM
jgi:hypothetical protein